MNLVEHDKYDFFMVPNVAKILGVRLQSLALIIYILQWTPISLMKVGIVLY